MVSGKINLLHYVAKVGVVAGRFLDRKGRIIMVFFWMVKYFFSGNCGEGDG